MKIPKTMISLFSGKMCLLVVCIFIAFLCIFCTSNYFIREGFSESFNKELHIVRNMVSGKINDLRIRFLQEAELLERDRELKEAILSRNHEVLREFCLEAKRHCHASFATITDEKGIVIIRGQSNKSGDSILVNPIIQDALKGIGVSDIVLLKNNGLSVAAATPIYYENKIIGSLLLGESFSTNNFVDTIKMMSDLETTIFLKTKRISTTIIHNGVRAVGTKIEDANVEKTVLIEKNIFSDTTTILGTDFSTMYWPLQNSSGETFGMFFIGKNKDAVQKTVMYVSWCCLASTIIIALALSSFGIYFFRSVVEPIEEKSITDFLTGIYNRAGFELNFETALTTIKSGTLFLIDLDNFKNLNDTLGHTRGDDCLKRIGKTLRVEFRNTDIVARLGGDEFIIYAPTMDQMHNITDKAKNLLQALHTIFKEDGKTVEITASIGIAIFPIHGTTYRTLYEAADSALYSVKNTGRNSFAVFGEKR